MRKQEEAYITKRKNLDGKEINPRDYQDFVNKVGAAVKSWETGQIYKVKGA